jgi:hypothetical protein
VEYGWVPKKEHFDADIYCTEVLDELVNQYWWCSFDVQALWSCHSQPGLDIRGISMENEDKMIRNIMY